MSNFGPPGGGSPDPRGGRPTSRYAGPPGGWGEPPADQRYAPTAPRYEPPAQRYAPSAAWDAGQPAPPAFPPAGPGAGGPPYPEPPRPERGRGRLVAALAVVAVLLLVAAAAFWVFGRDEPGPAGGSGASSAPTIDPSAGDPSAPATTAAAPASSTDPRFARVGQCVRNDGGVAEPKLVIIECAPKSYEVLSRIDGPTSGKKDAEAKCAKVTGYTDWFFYDSELDTLDFVLCLKRR
ncbi:flagellar basal body protein FliL [Micromonospora solifontis]|uniref:Flagellar basal body protein FliL n=1 Tax=Micromonospora solifontis TaxID=2487138 RepID=A0ABX9WI93_9ACTN|nr:flagellar basal body protein FliL [Micromonospora solifontis]NES17156.1 flagellar basal body protein FliL [Micromonospora sp. PPF5-17B]NES36246.1 flagellar basal body protein FliL [Micromonospora solifontis]NES58945.1 flagellar basal body protein FliL [Micromonospora sp. PPF5-6]RNL99833.1 flagellar basal body protein FliL [Micromonospora solifontis]